MAAIVIRGEVVYKCNVCNRKIRVPNNTRGLSIIYHCIITANCKGKLSQIISEQDIINTPTIPPEVVGISDWVQRKLLANHSQTIPMKIWTIHHNLSNNPIFDVRIIVGDKLVESSPQVVPIDQNTTNLIFNKPQSGTAQAITLSSQQDLSIANILSVDMVQISTDNGLLSIATLDNTQNMSIQFAYNVNNLTNSVLHLDYIIDDQPQFTSPWVDANKIFVNGQTYTVRNINLILDQNNYHYFASSIITQYSSITPTTINNLPIPTKSTVILLASLPFSVTDKVYNKIIYLDQISNNQIIYKDGAFYVSPLIINDIYPYIHVV